MQLNDLSYAIVVVSTSRNTQTDKVIPKLEEWIQMNQAGSVVLKKIVPDRIESIRNALKEYALNDCDVILFSGGTGVSPDDVTPESLAPLYERTLPGFDEAMRMESFKKTPNALISRSVSGIYNNKIVISLPGSPTAAIECFEVVYKALPHAVDKALNSGIPCGENS